MKPKLKNQKNNLKYGVHRMLTFKHEYVFVGSASWDKKNWQMRSRSDPDEHVEDCKKDCNSLANIHSFKTLKLFELRLILISFS